MLADECMTYLSEMQRKERKRERLTLNNHPHLVLMAVLHHSGHLFNTRRKGNYTAATIVTRPIPRVLLYLTT
jgi:hypothetical protein